jgi:hypothetical protein
VKKLASHDVCWDALGTISLHGKFPAIRPAGRWRNALLQDGTVIAIIPAVTIPPAGGSAPRGTVYIVGAFGILVVLGWLLLYFGLFLPRSTP